MLIDDLKMRLRVKYNNKVIVGTFGFEDLNNVVESVAREVCNEMRMANVKGSDTHEKLHMMVIAYQDLINQCEVNNDTKRENNNE